MKATFLFACEADKSKMYNLQNVHIPENVEVTNS